MGMASVEKIDQRHLLAVERGDAGMAAQALNDPGDPIETGPG